MQTIKYIIVGLLALVAVQRCFHLYIVWFRVEFYRASMLAAMDATIATSSPFMQRLSFIPQRIRWISSGWWPWYERISNTLGLLVLIALAAFFLTL